MPKDSRTSILQASAIQMLHLMTPFILAQSLPFLAVLYLVDRLFLHIPTFSTSINRSKKYFSYAYAYHAPTISIIGDCTV